MIGASQGLPPLSGWPDTRPMLTVVNVVSGASNLLTAPAPGLAPGLDLQENPLDDFAVREAAGDQLESLPLARGEPRALGLVGQLGSRLLGDAVDDAPCNGGREQ